VTSSFSISRPVPRGVNKRGAPTFDGRELKYWREAHGVTQTDVADALRMSQSWVSNIIEWDGEPAAVQVKSVVEYCGTVEAIAARRIQRAADGRAKLEAYRPTLPPPLDGETLAAAPMPRTRTVAETRAELIAEGRGGEVVR
jgi:hypothetical protein